MNLEKWAEQLTKEVYDTWKSKYYSKAGFKIFFGPVISNPKLMIISLNPGGNGKNFRKENLVNFKKGDFSLPKQNEYVTKEHRMAKKLKKFFYQHIDLLDSSVAFPILFFRSKNFRLWKKRHEKIKRKEMEEFCYDIVEEILKRIKPKILLVIGFKTYDRLKEYKIIDIKNEKPHDGKKKRKIAYSAQWNNIPVLVTLHLTGARISIHDFAKIQQLFFNIIK